MWKIFKELREYWSFFNFCYNWGPWPKTEWIYNNKIEPLRKEHPILCWIGILF